jgi:hypothetical protein
MVELVLQYNGHHKQAVFVVICIRKEDLILGLPWLKKHNLEINWTTESVKMFQCPSVCSICQEEVQSKYKTQHSEIHQI